MSRLLGLLVLVVCALAAALALDTARKKGAHYDEPKHLATGAALLEHGRFVGDDNTPLTVLFALPLATRTLDRSDLPREPSGKGLFPAGAAFLEKNGVLETLRPARAVSTAFFVVMLLLLARLAAKRAGAAGALLAVCLVAFDPTMLAHASIVSADLPLAVATLAALLAWRRFRAAPDPVATLGLAAAFGFVLLSKLNGALVVAVFGIEALLALRESGGGRVLLRFAAAAGAAVGLAALCFAPDPAAYFAGLARVLGYGSGVLPQYFAGSLGARSIWFYPAVIAFKATPAVIAAALVFVLVSWRRRNGNAAPERITLLLLAAFVLTPIASGYQQGIRFLLPALPLFAMVVVPGARLSPPLAPGRVAWIAIPSLLALATALFQHPHHLAYWNAFAGGSDRGDRWFVDSNGDWGQDVPALADFARNERADALYLAAYGSLRPSAYGLEYVDLLAGPGALVPPEPGERTLLAISDTIYRFVLAGGVTRNDPLLPLLVPLATIEPDARIAHTFRAWWVTPELLARLAAPR